MISNNAMLAEDINPIRNLPERWKHERIHNVASLRTSSVNKNSEEGENPVQLCNYTDVYYNEKITASIDFMQATASKGERERFSLEPGDVVITKDSESPDDIGVPALVTERIDNLVCGYHLTILRPFESIINGSYLFYALASRLSAYQFHLVANGVTRFGLTYQGTKNLRIAFPPLPEQKQLADFLDYKTAKIDALIAKNNQLIERLKEQRIAVITQAVTKGLERNAPMRDSGVEWLGQVPAHWETRRLRYCVDLVTSGSRGWAKYFSDSGSLFLRITNLNRQSISLRLDDVERVAPPEEAEGARTLTQPGDLLISITADLGSVAVIPSRLEPAYVSQHLALVRPEANTIIPEWLALSIFSHSGKSQLLTAGYGGTKVQLNLNDIKEIVFCHPPLREEQRRILRVIVSKTERIDRLVSLINQAITNLIEYRISLITAATTGKTDLRRVELVGAK